MVESSPIAAARRYSFMLWKLDLKSPLKTWMRHSPKPPPACQSSPGKIRRHSGDNPSIKKPPSAFAPPAKPSTGLSWYIADLCWSACLSRHGGIAGNAWPTLVLVLVLAPVRPGLIRVDLGSCHNILVGVLFLKNSMVGFTRINGSLPPILPGRAEV